MSATNSVQPQAQVDAGSIGPNIKAEPLSSWRPRPGEQVGFMVSTPARDGEHRTSNERTNIVLTTWPA